LTLHGVNQKTEADIFQLVGHDRFFETAGEGHEIIEGD
jgi:hypothetical protein